MDDDEPEAFSLPVSIDLHPGTPLSTEAAETARALVTARHEVSKTGDSALLNAEVTRAVQRLFEGLRVVSGQEALVAERAAWAGSLLAALAFTADYLVTVATKLAERAAREMAEGIVSEGETRQLLEAMGHSDHLLAITFQSADEKGWTL